jgi:hypothetical protein
LTIQRETIELFFYAIIGLTIAVLPVLLPVIHSAASGDEHRARSRYLAVAGIAFSSALFWLIARTETGMSAPMIGARFFVAAALTA